MATPMKLGIILSATDKMSRIINTATANITAKFSKIDKAMAGVNSASNKMFIAGGVAAAGIYKSVEAAEDGAASERKLANVFKTMWGDNGAANKAGKIASDYAETLSFQIGIEDDLIRTTQAKLASFSNVSNAASMSAGIFDRATKAAYDMGAVGFGEASQNAVMLGKALQDPMKMATALKKQGTLTADDIINIQSIYKTKGLLKAQEEVLKAVERQVKGTGIATVKATDIMKVGFGKITEAIGGAFLPTVDEAKGKMTGIFQPTIEWINNNHKLIITISKVAIGLLGAAFAIRAITTTIKVVKGIMIAWEAITAIAAITHTVLTGNIWLHSMAMKASAGWTATITAAQWLWNAAMTANPIGLIIAGVAALGVGLYFLVKHWDTVTAAMKKFGSYLISSVLTPVIWVLKALGKLTGAKWAINMAANLEQFKGKLDSDRASASSSKAVSSVTNTIMANKGNINSGQSPFSYSPTINISGGSAQDKAGIMSMFDTQRQTLEQMMTERENRKKRLNYAQ